MQGPTHHGRWLEGYDVLVQVKMIVLTNQANFVTSLGISSQSNEVQTLTVWHA